MVKLKPPQPIERKIIASPEDYIPSSPDCKVIGAFNPGGVSFKNKDGKMETLLMIRVAECPTMNLEENLLNQKQISNLGSERKIFLPYFKISKKTKKNSKINFDVITPEDISKENKKDVYLKNGTARMKHISLPRFLRLDEKENIIKRDQKPAIYPSLEYERFGMEDFRITPIEENKYILTHVSPHRDFGVSTYFLLTKDFKDYIRLSKENPTIAGMKDIVVFPKKILSSIKTETILEHEKIYACLTRPESHPDVSNPGIWISCSSDLVHWGQNRRLTISKNGEKTGSGTPPIKTENSWLSVYHETINKEYKAKLMMMDYNEPWKNISFSDVFLERKNYLEILPKDGYVPNVVFPTTITEKNGEINLYSGIDDTWTVMDKFYTEDLIKFLKNSQN